MRDRGEKRKASGSGAGGSGRLHAARPSYPAPAYCSCLLLLRLFELVQKFLLTAEQSGIIVRTL
jgi:hypothetical protein